MITFARGFNAFRAARLQREQRERSRQRCELLGIVGPGDPALLEKMEVAVRQAEHEAAEAVKRKASASVKPKRYSIGQVVSLVRPCPLW